LDASVQKLIDVYTKAKERLINLLAVKDNNGNSTFYEKALIKQIDAEIKKLNKEASGWAQVALPAAYDLGIDNTNDGLAQQGEEVPPLDATLAGLHTSAVKVIVNNTVNTLVTANMWVGRQLKDHIRQAGLEATAMKYASGQTYKQMGKEFKQRLLNENITSIKTTSGANIPVEKYAATVARSTTREATNTATMNQLTGFGYDLVMMSTHTPTCKLCAPLQGRVYSISGTDRRFPALGVAFKPPYHNVHPNCDHVIAPWVEAAKSRQEFAQAVRDSGKPFDVDPRSEAEKDKYNAGQKAKAELNSDAKKFQDVKAVLGDDAPKTFSAYRNIKKNYPEKFDVLNKNYRLAGQLQKKGIQYITRVDENQIVVNAPKVQINEVSQHVYDNMEKKPDRAGLDRSKGQKIINNSLLTVYQQNNKRLKYIAKDGFTIINHNNDLITIVPEKLRNKWVKYIKGVN